jgi:uncharacterized protein with ParB-like and HNH nuclease domain
MQPKIGFVRALLLERDTCLVIPPYQRPYEWTRDRWQSLIRDIVESLTSQRESHFIGVAITTESKPECSKAASQILHRHIDVIDGQQRLLTLRLWLQAIIDHSKDNGNDLETTFTNVYCQETDLDDWELVTKNKWIKKYRNYSSKESGLLHAYTYFRWILWLGQNSMTEQEPEELPKLGRNPEIMNSFSELEEFWSESLVKRQHNNDSDESTLQLARSNSIDPVKLLKATVDQLTLLVLEVSTQDEDPADIFNALNGQRTEMFQFDHLRNFIFANINDKDMRDQLYEETWKIAERQISKLKIPVKGSSAFDTYLYDLLISLGERRTQPISKDKTARQFSRYYNSGRNTLGAKGIAEKLVIPNLISWASVKISGEPVDIGSHTYELPASVRTSLVTMDWMSSGPVVPLLLNIVNRFYHQNLSEHDLKRGISAVENYLGRYIASGDALSPLRASIMNICGQLGRSYSLEELENLLLEIKHKDSDLKKRLLPSTNRANDPYGDYARIYENRTPRQILALFQGIERKRAGEHCVNLLRGSQDDQLSIDHIYPQSPDKWKNDIRNWETSPISLKNRLHTLGNLAIVPKSINSAMSNEKFLRKKEILKENTFVKLEVNQEWQAERVGKWTPEKIDERAEILLDDILKYYPY